MERDLRLRHERACMWGEQGVSLLCTCAAAARSLHSLFTPITILVLMLASIARRSATPGVLGSAKRGISVQVT